MTKIVDRSTEENSPRTEQGLSGRLVTTISNGTIIRFIYNNSDTTFETLHDLTETAQKLCPLRLRRHRRKSSREEVNNNLLVVNNYHNYQVTTNNNTWLLLT